jgi:uncharacterized membrane protein YbhN (UPF0104 family)
VSAIDPRITLATSFVCVPIALATQFLPITQGGAGAREAAFVALYGAFGMAGSDALAASLCVFVVMLAVGAVGGITPMPRTAPAATLDRPGGGRYTSRA